MIWVSFIRAFVAPLSVLFALSVPAPLVAAIPQVESQRVESVQSKNSTDNDETFHIWGDTPAQLVMAATSALALIVSIWAVWLLRGTLKATHAAVAAADDAVNETRRIGEAQTRAYITVDAMPFGEPKNTKTVVDFVVTNCGQTPARNLTITADLKLMRYPLSRPGYSINIEAPVQPETPNQIAAGGTSTLAIAIVLDEQQLQAVADARLYRLYLIGRIEYRDVFGHPHFSNFCFSYYPCAGEPHHRGRAPVDGPYFDWLIEPLFNEAD